MLEFIHELATVLKLKELVFVFTLTEIPNKHEDQSEEKLLRQCNSNAIM
jgi:hypothetical protein